MSHNRVVQLTQADHSIKFKKNIYSFLKFYLCKQAHKLNEGKFINEEAQVYKIFIKLLTACQDIKLLLSS